MCWDLSSVGSRTSKKASGENMAAFFILYVVDTLTRVRESVDAYTCAFTTLKARRRRRSFYRDPSRWGATLLRRFSYRWNL